MSLSDSTDLGTRVQHALGALLIALDDERDPLLRLDQLRLASHMVQGEIERTVTACREVQVPWSLIADALGLASKQAAHARYAALS